MELWAFKLLQHEKFLPVDILSPSFDATKTSFNSQIKFFEWLPENLIDAQPIELMERTIFENGTLKVTKEKT
jgi:hypothetical protein